MIYMENQSDKEAQEEFEVMVWVPNQGAFKDVPILKDIFRNLVTIKVKRPFATKK